MVPIRGVFREVRFWEGRFELAKLHEKDAIVRVHPAGVFPRARILVPFRARIAPGSVVFLRGVWIADFKQLDALIKFFVLEHGVHMT